MRFPAFGYLCRGRVLYLGVTRGYVVVATSLTTGRSEAGGSVGAAIHVWVCWSARRVPAVRFGWTRLVCTPTHSVIAHTLPTHVVWQPSPYICSIGSLPPFPLCFMLVSAADWLASGGCAMLAMRACLHWCSASNTHIYNFGAPK